MPSGSDDIWQADSESSGNEIRGTPPLNFSAQRFRMDEQTGLGSALHIHDSVDV